MNMYWHHYLLILVSSSILSLALQASEQTLTATVLNISLEVDDRDLAPTQDVQEIDVKAIGKELGESLVETINKKIAEARLARGVRSLLPIHIALKIRIITLPTVLLPITSIQAANRTTILSIAFKHLSKSPAIRTITSLYLTDCGLEEVPHLAFFARPSFTVLDVSRNPLRKEKCGTLKAVCGYLQHLTIPDESNNNSITLTTQEDIRTYGDFPKYIAHTNRLPKEPIDEEIQSLLEVHSIIKSRYTRRNSIIPHTPD